MQGYPEGVTALVTGGASGIGAASAKLLTEKGSSGGNGRSCRRRGRTTRRE